VFFLPLLASTDWVVAFRVAWDYANDLSAPGSDANEATDVSAIEGDHAPSKSDDSTNTSGKNEDFQAVIFPLVTSYFRDSVDEKKLPIRL
jgi:hypothetical protein